MIYSIKLKGICKTYRLSGFRLVIDYLELSNRHINVVVGPNGSGKTSLFKLVAILDRPDEGAVLFNDIEISPDGSGVGLLRKRIGFVMQNPYLFNMNVYDNVALGLRIRRYPAHAIDRKVKEMLSSLMIGHLTGQAVKSLSRGEYQKVAIAQVLAFEPEVILMDEPAANIDTQSILSIEGMIRSIYKKSNPVIIMTTHSLGQAGRMSPEIISMKEGKISDIINRNAFSFNDSIEVI